MLLAAVRKQQTLKNDDEKHLIPLPLQRKIQTKSGLEKDLPAFKNSKALYHEKSPTHFERK